MRILMTGATSFTGCHIARAFADAGHEVCALLTRPQGDYVSDQMLIRRLQHSGLRQEQLRFESAFGSNGFFESVKQFQPEIYINHGAEIKGYRSPDFDVESSVARSLFRHEEVVDALLVARCQGIIHSGSVFEPIDELPALSPYGQSKFLVSKALQNACAQRNLAFSKIYIANPIGAFENEDRLIPVFVKLWKSGQVPHLSAPGAMWDHVPAPWLASVYLRESESLFIKKRGSIKRPSGFQLDLESFLNTFCHEAISLGVRTPLDFTVSENPSAPPAPRLNHQPCRELNIESERRRFFQDWLSTLFEECENP